MRQYLDLIDDILSYGIDKEDRTGTGTRSIFGHQLRFNLNEGFPLVTTKKVHFKSIVHELLWFISGSTNIKYLNDNGVRIWNEWADSEGNIASYGYQWRNWGTCVDFTNCDDVSTNDNGQHFDQLSYTINQLKRNPNSRRHVISAWNVTEVPKMALPPCHTLFQFYVANGNLSCQVYQRSADVFLGVPFNIASYALLTHMVAQVCGLGVGDLVHTLGDAHIYNNHLPQALIQLGRDPLSLPRLALNLEVENIDDFSYEDITLIDYESHPHLKGDISV